MDGEILAHLDEPRMLDEELRPTGERGIGLAARTWCSSGLAISSLGRVTRRCVALAHEGAAPLPEPDLAVLAQGAQVGVGVDAGRHSGVADDLVVDLLVGLEGAPDGEQVGQIRVAPLDAGGQRERLHPPGGGPPGQRPRQVREDLPLRLDSPAGGTASSVIVR